MKWFSALLLITLASLLPAAEQRVRSVEGLFYLDQTPVRIDIADGIIAKIIRLPESQKASANYIAPGLIDIQINGYASIDFSGENLSVAGVRQATQALWEEGVTTFLPTLITNSHERLNANFEILAEAARDEEIGPSIPGFHLEGPYISSKDGFRGAHLKEFVRQPEVAQFLQYQAAAEDKILFLTLAPEVDGAIELIEAAVSRGVVVGIGHTAANAEQIKRAVDAGASISTHLGNGCANMIHRHDNPLWPQLADDRLAASLIVDGHHLRREQVQTFYKVKGSERILLISDALDLAGLPPGEYMAGGKKVVMTPEGIIKYPEQNVLAGASLPISRGVQNIMAYTHCSLADAIHMATRNQARHFGFGDRGELLPGKRADLVIFALQDGELQVRRTIVAGREVFSAD
ncbi:N-acetylglucosamine-6-phosphate deacetylase [candidate division KSB1 bacterium]|nr:N-acetylglucosamine-6-phosphate deacetylase [candidate division KSB1 bacterium]RQW07658.1 MAG: N-acetylglucosamine-6-phosphate deacetylase [candidate division KSB1 bacterium]